MQGIENFKKIVKEHSSITVFAIGSLGYCAIELLWRGHTHWSMALAGGICFSLITAIQKHFPNMRFLYKCIMGSICITVVEFVFGLIFNILLNKNVWDYSNVKFNILGQVCLLYTVLWGFITALALPLSKKLISALQK